MPAPIIGAGMGPPVCFCVPLGDGTPSVLLQHRALWSHQGGTWGLPGGALDSHETPEQAAVPGGLRGSRPGRRASAGACGSDHCRGVRTRCPVEPTVVADAASLLRTERNRESTELRWVPEDEVADLPLHPASPPVGSVCGSLGRCRRTTVSARGLHLAHTVVTGSAFAWCTPTAAR